MSQLKLNQTNKIKKRLLVKDILKQHKIAFSLEFFPPKTEKSAEALFQSINNLLPLEPAYVSVTYGAGGSTRELTHDLIVKLQKETNITVVSHLTCVGASKDEIHETLESYYNSGIKNFMALRGDPPRGTKEFIKPENGFEYASELVAFIKKHFPDTGIGVAGYPEGHPDTPNRLKEMDHLKAKVDAGADYICTQLFYENRDYYDFKERCILAGIKVPILAGILPMTSLKSKDRMADMALGVRYPARLLKAFDRAVDDSHVEKVGIQWASEQVRDLIDNGVEGVHFYTFNRSEATRQIYDALGVTNSNQLER